MLGDQFFGRLFLLRGFTSIHLRKSEIYKPSLVGCEHRD